MQIQKLKQLIDGDVVEDTDTLTTYSHDASVFEIKPEAVVFPKNSQDIKNIVRFVSEHKEKTPALSITARAAGTCMSGGAVNDSIILDSTKYMNHITEIAAGYASAEPGVYYRNFEKETKVHGLIMPAYPASKNICALGGMLGNNSGGEKSLQYGQCKDYVQELHVVLADAGEYIFGPLTEDELAAKLKSTTFEGQIYRDTFQLIKDNYEVIKKAKPSTTKNSSGYFLWDVWNKETRIFNLAKLFVGSQGTLGIITKVTFKLVAEKSVSSLLIISLNESEHLADIVAQVKLFNPESFEIFDDLTLKLAKKVFPEIAKDIGIKKPSFFGSRIEVPKLTLLAEFSGYQQHEVTTNIVNCQRNVQKRFKVQAKIAVAKNEVEHYWTVRRESFNMLRAGEGDKITAPFVDDIIVHPKDLPTFLPKLNAIFVKYQSLTYTIAGHAGDANFHIIPLMDLSQASERAIIPKLSQEVFSLVKEFHGSMSAEHNDGLIRGPYLEYMYGKEVFDVFKKVKRIFDPQNIFNPHKKTDATLEFQAEHIRRN